MRNKLLVLWIFMLLLTAPAVAVSDCLDLGQANNYYIQGSHAVIFYAGIRPLARIEIPYCILYQDSTIRLSKSYTCDADKIMIDGEQCSIGTVSSAATNPMY